MMDRLRVEESSSVMRVWPRLMQLLLSNYFFAQVGTIQASDHTYHASTFGFGFTTLPRRQASHVLEQATRATIFLTFST